MGKTPLTTGTLAALVGGELVGPADLVITGIDAIDAAAEGDVTFIRSAGYAGKWGASGATAALVTRGIKVDARASARPEARGTDGEARATVKESGGPRRALIYVADADAAVIAALRALAPAPARPRPGVHPLAWVDPSAKIDPAASIGPLCAVGPGAIVGPGALLMNTVTLCEGASVGEGSVLHPAVVLAERCSIGAWCIVHPGAKIGADGFGYAAGPQGAVKIPHIGNVVIGDHVEIGANACIDRAKFGSTTIGDGTKIDNLVQIGHNCRIGRACLICGQCGLSGSVTLGDGVILAGGVGVADNLTIGPGAKVGARSGVMNDIPAGESWLGAPAQPVREAALNIAVYRDLARHVRELRRALKAEAPGA